MCALTVEASAGSVTVGLVAPGVLRCLNRHERSAAIAVAIYVYVVRFGAGSDEVEDAAVVDKWIAAGRSANRRISAHCDTHLGRILARSSRRMAFLCLTPIETALFDHLFDGVTRSDDQPRAAHDLFIRSRLPRGTLAHIWRLAGVSQNGVLSRERFYIAMRLIALCQQGYEPTADNAKTITSLPLPDLDHPFEGVPRIAPVEQRVEPIPAAPVAAPDDDMWKVAPASRHAYAKRFQAVCPDGEHTISRKRAASALLENGDLEGDQIERIIHLADVDGDNRLDEIQFVAAAHLFAIVMSRRSALPDTLPPAVLESIMPPRRAASVPKTQAAVRLERYLSELSTSWDFEGVTLNEQEAVQIAKELFKDDNQHVASLSLKNTRLPFNGFAALSKMLCRNRGITTLVLDGNTVTEGVMPLLVDAIRGNPSLAVLCMNDCTISADDAMTLLDSISKTSPMRRIHLLGNSLLNPVSQRLLQIARNRTSLTQLCVPTDFMSAAIIAEYQYLLDGQPRPAPAPAREKKPCRRIAVDTFADLEVSSPTVQAVLSPRRSATVDGAQSVNVRRQPDQTGAVRSRIEQQIASLRDSLKDWSDKLSVSLVDGDTDASSSTPLELIQLMRLQTTTSVAKQLNAVLSVKNVREALLVSLGHSATEIAALVSEIDNLLMSDAADAVDSYRREQCLPVLKSHCVYDGIFYLHRHPALFAFYRHLQLSLCDVVLTCLQQRASGAPQKCLPDLGLAAVLPPSVVDYIASMSSSTSSLDWVHTFAEEVARRATFRYEAQIRRLSHEDARTVARCALHRICAALEQTRSASTFSDDVDYVLERLGSADQRSRFKPQVVHPVMAPDSKEPQLKWNVESIFVKPGLAVADSSPDYDRIVVEDGQFRLWATKTRHVRHDKYGFRLASPSELQGAARPSWEEVPSPPTSRWMRSGDGIRKAKAEHVATHATRTLNRWGVPPAAAMNGPDENKAVNGNDKENSGPRVLTKMVAGLFTRRSQSVTRVRRPPAPRNGTGAGDDDEIARLRHELEQERHRRILAEQKLAAALQATAAAAQDADDIQYAV
ncbi:Calmodulin [Plasmodiophora brassicae]